MAPWTGSLANSQENSRKILIKFRQQQQSSTKQQSSARTYTSLCTKEVRSRSTEMFSDLGHVHIIPHIIHSHLMIYNTTVHSLGKIHASLICMVYVDTSANCMIYVDTSVICMVYVDTSMICTS